MHRWSDRKKKEKKKTLEGGAGGTVVLLLPQLCLNVAAFPFPHMPVFRGGNNITSRLAINAFIGFAGTVTSRSLIGWPYAVQFQKCCYLIPAHPAISCTITI